MASRTLPVDILFLIMEASPLSDIGKMTRTCHSLRQGGARFLLDRGVLLTTGTNIISFIRFLNADAAARFQYLRTLEIATGELRPREVDALLGLISHPLLALDSLTLREADLMLKSTPKNSRCADSAEPTPLVTAFSALTTLRHLTVDECDQLACSLISAIRSPLRTVSIGFTPLTTWHNAEDAERRNPIVLLADVSETLEEISASNVAMALEYVMYDVVYPSVRRVTVTFDLAYSPKTIAYTTSFPNLTHFSFIAANGHAGGNFEDLVEYRHATLTRTANKENLERHGRSWMHLEELVGGVPDLFILGLSCHVPKLHLTGPVLLSYSADALRAILVSTHPTSLVIRFVGANWFEGDSNAIATILAHPGMEDLRALEMEVCLDVDEDYVDVQTMLNNVASTLAPIPLRDLTLVLNYGLFAGVDENGEPLYPISRDFEGVDLDAAASLFRAVLPSLVGVVVRRSTDSMWYSVMYPAHGDDDSDSSDYFSPISLENELEGELGGLMMDEEEHGW